MDTLQISKAFTLVEPGPVVLLLNLAHF